jgi:hypothetical protein
VNQRQGFRYLTTATDSTVRHFSASDPIPDDIDVDPPAPPLPGTVGDDSGDG